MRKLMSALGAALVLAAAMAVPAAAVPPPPDYTAWVDLGIVYGAGPEKAYYPSVIYDASAFGVSGGPTYKMWYSDGAGNVKVVGSSDGVSWGSPASATGLGGDAHHVQVVYDANCFASSCGTSDPKYKMWYWDIDAYLYSINAIAYAESSDGASWTDQAITQGSPELVTGAGSGWNRGSYGPIDVLYRPGALNTGTDPWGYSYVMYYDGTDGSSEVTGLAYSANGLTWTAYSASPVLDKGAGNAWDCDDAVYGTVYQDGNGYHFWYSGGGGDNGSGGCAAGDPVHEGIGYASSSDGLAWTKDTGNPILHITDGAAHRSQRTYAPAVVDDGSPFLRMYYSAVSGTGDYAIGLAVLQTGAGVPAPGTWTLFPGQVVSYETQVLPPINADGTSNWPKRRGVIPVQFALSKAVGPAILQSICSDGVCPFDGSDPDDYSFLKFVPATPFPFSQLGVLKADYSFTTGNCHGGALRWQVRIDVGANGEPSDDGNVFIYYGDPPSFTDCEGSANQSGDNMVGRGELRYDLMQVGGPFYGSYAQALALVGSDPVLRASLVMDGGWVNAPSGDQVAVVTSATVNDNTFTPLPEQALAPTCDLPQAEIKWTKSDPLPSGTINETAESIQTKDSGQFFRVVDCRYEYNLDVASLDANLATRQGTYFVYVKIGGTVILATPARFDLR